MVPQRLVVLRALRSPVVSGRLPLVSARTPLASTSLVQKRTFLPESIVGRANLDKHFPDPEQLSELEDPEMNGGYINPPRIKRQFRDPYGDWWDKQERRNFGEPLHEDNDMLCMFSYYEYDWTTTGKGAVMFATAVGAFLSVVGAVWLVYPDRKSYPREFEGGLKRELGGSGGKRARMAGDPDP
ncbi:hypothetical protein TD95_001424 [Thielaviopsis punctulata]|uniref:Uncharacterized protein n=1 Tax=Thielaviopsis punctulata TaxID=72032 RepID=A0A0F4ZAN1_9PEZI|nr:hypothetical protein TD95_001424 [Thielaviopsis punctulata]